MVYVKSFPVSVEISIDGYLRPSKWEGEIKEVREFIHVFPKANWDYAALRQVREEQPVNLVMKVTVNEKALPDQTKICLIKSINECPFYVLWPGEDEDDPEIEDFSFLFAAYVNENHPWIDELFLEDSINAKQANCVDGSVLMASILQKIGIEPFLVMVPGHCFLAYLDGTGDDASIVGLETTMLGNSKIKKIQDLEEMTEKLRKKEFAASAQTFLNAIETGTASMLKHEKGLQSDEKPDTQLISITDARELGIRPIASRAVKEP